MKAVLAGLLVGAALLVLLPGFSAKLSRVQETDTWWGRIRQLLAGGSRWVRRLRGASDTVTASELVELAETLELMAIGIEAGASVSGAVELAAQLSPGQPAEMLQPVLAQLKLGADPRDAWRELSQHQLWGPVARDVANVSRSGVALSGTLRAHAAEARLLRQDRAEQRARTAGVRSVLPLMCCFLPAFILVGVVPVIAGLLGRLLGT